MVTKIVIYFVQNLSVVQQTVVFEPADRFDEHWSQEILSRVFSALIDDEHTGDELPPLVDIDWQRK